jgi:hypothetical protein
MSSTYKSLDAVTPSLPLEKHDSKNRTFQGIPGIVRLPSGRHFATWYGGGPTECRENYAILALADHDGSQWRDPVAVVDPPTPEVRAFDPVLWVSPQGLLYWFWSQSCAGEEDGKNQCDGIEGVCFSILKNPDAEPENFQFTPARRIANGVMMNKPSVLSDGVWALPVTSWIGSSFKNPSMNIEDGWSFLVSEDEGKTFYSRATVCMNDIEDGPSCEEHSFIEHPDGSITCYLRVNAGIAECVSRDRGFSWSKPVISETVTGPNSRAYFCRLKSGRLLMVNHDCPRCQAGDPARRTRRKRDRLTAYLSEDEGRSWPFRLLLDEREASYPDAHEDARGNILVVYDRCRLNGGYIYYAMIREEDIKAGKLVSPESFLRREIAHSRPVEKKDQKPSKM